MAIPRQSDRAFGISFAALFAAVFAIAWLAFDAVLLWAAVLAAALLACALARPAVLLPLNRVWHRLAGGLAAVNNWLLLGLFFYLVIAPTGMVLRLFGWNPLGLRGRKSGSGWTAVGRGTTAETMRDMF